MAEKEKNMVTRAQVQEKLEEGYRVGIFIPGTGGGANLGVVLRQDEFGALSHNLDDFFPNDKAKVEAVLTHTPVGHLTRDGMEHAIRSGGSVMLGGQIYTSLEKLPSQEKLDEIHERQQKTQEEAIDAQIANLSATRSRVAAMRGEPSSHTFGTVKSKTKSDDADADDGDDYEAEGTTKEDLLNEARGREGRIEGFSTMTKDQLVKALRADDAAQRKGR